MKKFTKCRFIFFLAAWLLIPCTAPAASHADFKLEFVHYFPSTMNGQPTIWVRLRVTNTGSVRFSKPIITQVTDLDTNEPIYGGKDGMSGSGFQAGVLSPGETAFLAVRIGEQNPRRARA